MYIFYKIYKNESTLHTRAVHTQEWWQSVQLQFMFGSLLHITHEYAK